ncbi:Hsp20/alpha crystallin family protein [Chengkuizengella marina]|uniref:Hsp20/alpha crystallin family protein n=1 Tax=Chengkuizengella marina TaxID=2507566 RepID=A0A6N9PYR4_9BACL|nr:Hsp20/alpha crystallin family protein [Chengkuizengella marina]NBI27952.1 Hsp20/alpha crystallin family protein [Chengkuizengella marina]
MSLIPFEPFRELDTFRRELDNFFNSKFPSGFNFGMPRIDIHETDNVVIVMCDLPALQQKDDVSIDIHNNVLTISGSINKSNEVKEEHLYKRERYSGQFRRSIPLPASVSDDDVKAVYKNGVLEIKMHKINESRSKKINIDFE